MFTLIDKWDVTLQDNQVNDINEECADDWHHHETPRGDDRIGSTKEPMFITAFVGVAPRPENHSECLMLTAVYRSLNPSL